MCLTIYSTAKPVSKILKKNRKVFKRLETVNGNFYTPYQVYQMKEGEHYYQTGKKFTVEKGFLAWEIHRGLHAYTTYEEARVLLKRDEVIVEMYIPEGSEFFENKIREEICADNLVWPVGAKIYNPHRLKIK